MVTRAARLVCFLALALFLCPHLPAKPLADYKLGDTVEEDIVTPVPLVVIDAAATQALRDKETQKLPVFFGYDSNVANRVEADFLSAFNDMRRQFLDELERAFQRRTLDAAAINTAQFNQFVASFQERRKEFPLTAELAAQWASGESGEPVRAEWRRRLHQMTGYYILPDDVPPDLKLGPQVRILQRPTAVFAPNLETAHQAGRLYRASNLYTLSRARRELPGTFDPDARALAAYLAGFLKANCVLEADLTRQVRVRRAEPILVTDRYEACERIATRGQVISAKTLAVLAQLKEKLAAVQEQRQLAESRSKLAAERRRNQWLLAGALVLVVGLGLVAWRLAARRRTQILLPVRVNAASEAAQTSLRAGLLAQLAQLMTDKLVQKLVSDRRGLLDAQQKAAQEMAELEARLEKIHAPLQDRLEAYEKRIAELEKELADRGEENRVLIEAKISQVRRQVEIERGASGLARN